MKLTTLQGIKEVAPKRTAASGWCALEPARTGHF